MAGLALGAGAGAIIAANTAAAAAATTTAAAAAAAAVLRFAAQMALQYAIGALAQQLMGRGKAFDGTTSSLLGLPVNNTDPGAPRVWALGYRVRVPMQIMWQSRKVRDVSNSIKGKAGISVRHTTFDLAFLLNDRYTHKLSQMIANDGLLTFDTLNLITLRNHLMTAVESGGSVVLTASSTDDPDFNLVFEVGDMVETAGFVAIGATPNPNGKYWEVTAITGHTSSPSTMTIGRRSNQTVAGINATGGNAFAPAIVTRIDDAVLSESFTVTQLPVNLRIRQSVIDPANHAWDEVFRPGDELRISIAGVATTTVPWRVMRIAGDDLEIQFGTLLPWGSVSATNHLTVEFWTQPTIATEYFQPNFLPRDHFYHGDETQTENATIVAIEGAGEVGGFRGQSYQVVPQFDATNLGGTVPPMTEASIDPDLSMTWGQALIEVAGRHGLTADHIDVSGVTREPFLGMYLRGATNGAQALQQLLLLKQIATQDRNGVIAFFQIDNADTVSIQNGDLFSDFAAVVGGKPGPKLSYGEVIDKDLPTMVDVRFQDPDSGYGENHIPFGLRHPSASGEENRASLDFKNVVMTKKDARNFAATIARRARINSKPVSFTLPASYLHILENDLLTYTDDQDETHLVRVVRRDIGANLLVRIEAVTERANVQVSGSPVQSGAGSSAPVIVGAADLAVAVFDCPPIEDADGITPGVYVAACARPGSSWGGATIHMSNDMNNWTVIGTLTQPHALGTVTSEILEAAAPSESLGSTVVTWDTVGSIDIDFDSTGPLALSTFPLASIQAVLDGWNWFALIDGNGQVVEVFAARVVTPNTSTNYTLSYLLRGLRGTWQRCAEDRIVEGMQVVGVQHFYGLSGEFIPLPGLTPNQSIAFKVVPPGRDLATSPTVGLTTTRRNVLPFALRDVTKSYDVATDDVTFTAHHWSRMNISVGNVGPYPLDEPYEAYRFTLYHQSGNGQAVFVRTKSAQGSGSSTLRDPFVTFTSAEQTAAGYTPSGVETYWIDVQQIGQYGLSPSILQEL